MHPLHFGEWNPYIFRNGTSPFQVENRNPAQVGTPYPTLWAQVGTPYPTLWAQVGTPYPTLWAPFQVGNENPTK